MAVTQVAYAQQDVQPGSSITITKPGAVTTDDILVFGVSYPYSFSLTTPSGLTLLTDVADPSNSYRLAIYAKTAGSSEPSTYAWGLSSSYWWSVELVVLRGAVAPSVWATGTDSLSTTVTFPSVTVPSAGGYLLLLATNASNMGGIDPAPSGFTDLTSTHYWPLIYGKASPSTGASGVQTVGHSNACSMVSATVFVPIASGGGGATAPANTVVPTITGTAGTGNTLTGHLGTWSGTPTSYSYEFRWLLNSAELTSASQTYKTIPGTTGTTSSSATTPTYVQRGSDAGQDIFLHVTATNTSGTAAADSVTVINYNAKVPFKSSGNPFTTALPVGVPLSTSLTATLRTQLSSWYSGGRKWWLQGGEYGGDYSSHLILVDSTMPRTPIQLIGRSASNAAGDISQPKATHVRNGDIVQHLAWSMGTKNGGVPTPPQGFQVVPGGDLHMVVFCTDTYEMWEFWVLFQTTGTTMNWGGTPVTVHPDYLPVGSWCAGWGGYIRDVRTHPGYWQDKTDVDGNFEYAGWGAMATSLAYFQITMLMRELVTDNTVGHAIGVVTPGSTGGHVWPAQRGDTGAGGTLPQGIVWQLDPSINVDALPTLGNAVDDNFRKLVFKAAQTYGLVTCDSTGNDIILRMEAMPGNWPNIPNAIGTTRAVTFDQLMQSVPVSSWSVVSPAYRPVGAPQLPKFSDLVDDFAYLKPNWTLFSSGSPAYANGWLNIPVSGFGGLYDSTPRSLLNDTCYLQPALPAGNQNYDAYISPSSSSNGALFRIVGGRLICLAYDQYGFTISGTTDVAYSATNHKWIRWRADSSVIYMETSPGGGGTDPTAWTWTEQRHFTPDWDMSVATLVFYVQGTDTSNVAAFDNLNTTGSVAAGSTGWRVGALAW